MSPKPARAPAHTIGVRDLKNHASQILERVEAGERMTITRNGREIARLVPIQNDGFPSLHERLRSKGWVASEPTMTLEEVLKPSPLPKGVKFDAEAALRAILEDRESE